MEITLQHTIALVMGFVKTVSRPSLQRKNGLFSIKRFFFGISSPDDYTQKWLFPLKLPFLQDLFFIKSPPLSKKNFPF